MTDTNPMTGGWLRAMRHTLGLQIGQMASILDVRVDTLRQRWEHGSDPIPPGVRDDALRFVHLTDNAVDSLRRRAERIAQPAIVVYEDRSNIPMSHIANVYGLDWWDRVAISTARCVPTMMVGYPWEIATAYQDDPAGVHENPNVLGLYITGADGDPLRSGAYVS